MIDKLKIMFKKLNALIVKSFKNLIYKMFSKIVLELHKPNITEIKQETGLVKVDLEPEERVARYALIQAFDNAKSILDYTLEMNSPYNGKVKQISNALEEMKTEILKTI